MKPAAGPVHNRVLLLLVGLAALAVWGLAFLTVAPNRLVSGTGVRLGDLMHGARWGLLLPAGVLVAACAERESRDKLPPWRSFRNTSNGLAATTSTSRPTTSVAGP